MTPEELVAALRRVPEARLKIFALARELAGPDGLDFERAIERLDEIEAASKEASAYAAATQEVVRCLLREFAHPF